jgi:hypothetical protein
VFSGAQIAWSSTILDTIAVELAGSLGMTAESRN